MSQALSTVPIATNGQRGYGYGAYLYSYSVSTEVSSHGSSLKRPQLATIHSHPTGVNIQYNLSFSEMFSYKENTVVQKRVTQNL
jgi:hypothetical protein